MNRRTALGAIAASPVLVASAGAASPDNVTVDVPQMDDLDFQCRVARLAREILPAVALHPNATARAFNVAEEFVAESHRRTKGFC